ncbi:hypothetical protein BGX38DRAFT_1141147 [Terfezia claveryi]|nr:hypothetical protein BGX38DRAFT_1141147 [Terfezia claveryi]
MPAKKLLLRHLVIPSDQVHYLRIQKKQQGQVNVQNFTINAIGGANTINATATGTAITTTTNLNPTSIVKNVDVGVEIKQESPVAWVPLKEEISSPAKRKVEPKAEAEYAPWPTTPPLPRKRRQTTNRTTPYTDAQPAQFRPAPPATNLPPPMTLPIRQRLILLQDKLTQLEHDRERQLARLSVQWVRFKEADGRMGEVVREVKEELGRIVEERELREGDEMLTSMDETVRGSQEEWRSE